MMPNANGEIAQEQASPSSVAAWYNSLMGLPAEKPRHSIVDYLTLERSALDKHEYRDGEILMMAGGTINHSLAIANVIRVLGNAMTGKPCNVFDSNLRVRIPPTILYTYPDISVVCGPRRMDPNDPFGETVTNPKVIVEVLSPSTEAYDRGEKFNRYRQLDSLEEYVLVSLTTPRVENFWRQPAFAAQPETAASSERIWLFSATEGDRLLGGVAHRRVELRHTCDPK